MKRVALAGAVLAAVASSSAFAQEDGGGASAGPDLGTSRGAIANRFYIAPMASHVWEDSERQTDDGWGGKLALGKQLSESFMVELDTFYQEFHVGGPFNKSMKTMGVGLSGLFFPLNGGLSRNFYGIAGAHYGKGKKHPASDGITVSTDNYNTVFGSAGAGFLFGPIPWLNGGAFRAEALYRMDFHDEPDLGGANADDFGDAVVNFGFLVPIGAQPQPPAPAEPPPVEVVPAAAPADSDGDGVTDDLDQCPGTPAGEPVNEVGCPLPKKECKTPEPGQPVTLEGCAAGDKIVLRGVNFEYDKSRLTSNAKTILDDVTDALNAASTVTVELGGHTDARGSDEYNQKLSERRASSVRQYLIGKGVDAGRMTAVGYGESQPVADNETDEGRELNRRVELKITGGTTETSAPAAEAAPAAEEAAPAADAPAE